MSHSQFRAGKSERDPAIDYAHVERKPEWNSNWCILLRVSLYWVCLPVSQTGILYFHYGWLGRVRSLVPSENSIGNVGSISHAALRNCALVDLQAQAKTQDQAVATLLVFSVHPRSASLESWRLWSSKVKCRSSQHQCLGRKRQPDCHG